MLVTPGDREVHGGTSAPSRSAHGSTQPPMHASTWQRTPRASAAAAISATGSITPCAYDGAEATTSTRRVVVDRRGHGRGVGAHGDRVDGDADPARPRSSAPPCGTPRAPSSARPSRGSAMPGGASRAACTASRIDSVPPDVTVPTALVGAVEAACRRIRRGRCSIAQQARERRRVEAVRRGVHRQCLPAELVGVGQPGVVDVGQRAAAVVGRSPARSSLEPAQDRRQRPPYVVVQVVERGSGASDQQAEPRSAPRARARSRARSRSRATSGCTAVWSVDDT